MGYFLEYELFTPCWHCGRTDCTGNHREVPGNGQELPHHTKGFGHPECQCQVCREMRLRRDNRRKPV